MGLRTARWELGIAANDVPLRPGWLHGPPVPRTKLEANVPEGLISGMLAIDGQTIGVSGWRGTARHNLGSEHADSGAWLHAAGFGESPDGWLELVLARIGLGPGRSPWLAMGQSAPAKSESGSAGFGGRLPGRLVNLARAAGRLVPGMLFVADNDPRWNSRQSAGSRLPIIWLSPATGPARPDRSW